ncbi:hypothetical protein N825_17235 [Skermanella stibiiresistens SB22]|uniref:Phasin domain-containing protein n=1 Tax=Skermanella stibiiresistens SB22 TaxID=1385369 RepID=W9GV14_9PROT|nr:hypothetical protein [Skermanella stibiiresistens]EWY37614.1 hypothetical protein N825_17235 [Skermanella stibiiresistens SB22]
MQNLYTAKNPFMSMWLSAFNQSAGMMRGAWAAEMHKQQQELTRNSIDMSMRFWMPMLTPPRDRK